MQLRKENKTKKSCLFIVPIYLMCKKQKDTSKIHLSMVLIEVVCCILSIRQHQMLTFTNLKSRDNNGTKAPKLICCVCMHACACV